MASLAPTARLSGTDSLSQPLVAQVGNLCVFPGSPWDRMRFRLAAAHREPGPSPPRSDVEVLDVEGVLLDEIAAGLDLLAHQHAEQVVGCGRVGHRDS